MEEAITVLLTISNIKAWQVANLVPALNAGTEKKKKKSWQMPIKDDAREPKKIGASDTF